MSLTIERMTELNNGIGPNAMNIRSQATRVINGPMPARVRKKGLLPEIFFHPDHLHGAKDRQKREAEYSAKCIAGVVA